MFSGETVHVSSTLRSQESRAAAKKNFSLKLRLGGGPLKTHYAPHFHRFSFPMLLFEHSWRASSLAPLSFRSFLQITSAYGSHFSPSRISWAFHEQSRRNQVQTVASKASSHWVNYLLDTWGVDEALLSTSTLSVAFIEDLGSCQSRAGSLWSGLRWQGCVVPTPQASSVTTARIWQGHSREGRGDTPMISRQSTCTTDCKRGWSTMGPYFRQGPLHVECAKVLSQKLCLCLFYLCLKLQKNETL